MTNNRILRRLWLIFLLSTSMAFALAFLNLVVWEAYSVIIAFRENF